MSETTPNSDSELDDPAKITDAKTCLDYLKRREVFLYKMMNDPSHKAMLYFLEVLMNSDGAVTVDQLVARFTNKSFSQEMREACGGGSPENLKEFLQRYPSLFTVHPDGRVTSVTIDLPNLDLNFDGFSDLDSNPSLNYPKSCLKSGNLIEEGMSETTSLIQKESTHLNIKFQHKNKQNSSNLSLDTSPSANSLNGLSSMTRSISPHSSIENVQNKDIKEVTNKTSLCNSSQLAKQSLANSCQTCKKTRSLCQPMSYYDFEHLKTCNCCPPSKSIIPSCETAILPPGTERSCLAYPLLEVACHHNHQCTQALHHQASTAAAYYHCVPAAVSPVSAFHHCHHPLHISTATVSTPRQAVPSFNCCTLSPMTKLVLETEAVRFFQQRLLKRDERWVTIKSLAGHLSQATPEIRSIVGPQLEFKQFLLKHPHVFEVQGDLVSIKDLFSGVTKSRKNRDRFAILQGSHSSTNLNSISFAVPSNYSPRVNLSERTSRPKSLILANTLNPLDLLPNHPVYNYRPACFEDGLEKLALNSKHGESANLLSSISSGSRINGAKSLQLKNGVRETNKKNQIGTYISTDLDSNNSCGITNSLSISMTASEYRAIMFLRKSLEKLRLGRSGVSLSDLLQFLSTQAPESIQTTIGWTKIELEEFLSQHTTFFELSTLEDQGNKHVINKRLNRMINIVITSSRSTNNSLRMLTNRCGRIFHVAKLWGIIDLGKHEHVFFDKSIFRHVDDLQKHFKVDEILYFNAILAPKESRAKWRATQVWKECDREIAEKYRGLPKLTGRSGKNSTSYFPKLLSNITPATSDEVSKVSSLEQVSNRLNLLTDDRETEEEVEDIEYDRHMEISQSNFKQKSKEYLLTYDFDGSNDGDDYFDDDVEEGLAAIMAREEGMHLINDIKFLSAEEDEKIEISLNKKSSCSELKTGLPITANNMSNSYNLSSTFQLQDQLKSFVTSSNEQNLQGHFINEKDGIVDSGASCSSVESNGISIAVQTLSTGDIMATQLYHDYNQ